MNVPPSKKAQLLFAGDQGRSEFVADGAPAGAAGLRFPCGGGAAWRRLERHGLGRSPARATVYIPLSELVDLEKELKPACKGKKTSCGAESAAHFEASCKTRASVSKAPAHVVEAEREKAEKARQLIAKLEENLKNMK